MTSNKTQATAASVQDYLQSRADATQLADCQVLLQLMQQVTGEPAVMWGPSIVGFGSYRYRYASGHSGEICLLGFAVRGRDLVLYLAPDFFRDEQLPELYSDALHATLLAKPSKKPPLKLSKGCLYFKRLADLNLHVLRDWLAASLHELLRRHPQG